MQGMAERRLFFGFSVNAAWPMTYPKGRIIDEASRHLTLAFLGNISFDRIENALKEFPKPNFFLGPVGLCDRLLFLPEITPRVVAYHVSWISDGGKLGSYHDQVLQWLKGLGFSIDKRPFLPHITLARTPFTENEWESAFESLPVIVTGIHLYESMGNLRYHSIWELPLIPAFEEFEHTADIAFTIRGKNYEELYQHAAVAMSFKYPQFLSFLEERKPQELNQVVQALNKMLSLCDQEIGCPFKAVSYHGALKEKEYLEWEMVVDV